VRLSDFIEKYNGVAVDYDKAHGAQCVDLARQYWQDVWKVPQPELTGSEGAAAFFFKHDSSAP
jgi:hypothetical protein